MPKNGNQVDSLICHVGKPYAFHWNTDRTQNLRFEPHLIGETRLVTISTQTDEAIEHANLLAQGLKALVISGIDPHEVECDKQAATKVAGLTAGEV